MQGKFDQLRRAPKLAQFAMCGVVLLLGVQPTRLFAQGGAIKAAHCFSIQMHLNGEPMEGPKVVTLKSRKGEDTVPLASTCFPVPSAILQSELLEISFTVPGNKIHMSDMPPDFFNGQWDVRLADKKFSKDVSVPKHGNVNEICAVVIHEGASEQSVAQPQCRTAISDK